MTGKRNLTRTMNQRSNRQPKKNMRFSGYLGIRTGGQNVVDVPARPGFVWVRLRNTDNEVIQAFNETTSPTYNLPVVVERDDISPVRYRIVGRDVDVYGSNWGSSSSYLPAHGYQHSFNNDDTKIGGDVVWVYTEQFTEFLVMPSGSFGSGNVLIGDGIYLFTGTFHYAGSTGTADILECKPTGSSTARMVLCYLDRPTGNFYFSTGTFTEFSASITGTPQVVPYIPSPPLNSIPLAAIRLVSGTSSILWPNIYDVRQFFGCDTSSSSVGGLAHGSMYSNDSLAVTMTNQNTWYEINAATAWTVGILNGFSFTDPYITALKSGTYLITWSSSGNIGTANQGIAVGIMIDSTTVQNAGQSRFYFLNATRNVTVGSTALITLSAGQKVSLAVRNITSAGKVYTQIKGNLTVVQIG